MLVRLVVLGVVIGSNNLAAALGLGAMGQVERRGRIVTVFAAFEFLIPLVGIWLGRAVSGAVTDQAAWLGPALLVALGVWMLWSAARGRRASEDLARRITSWKGLLLLALGLSIDNLVIGFSLGLEGREPLLVAGTIAVFSMAFTWAGITLGSSARRHWERYAEVGAGVLLLAMAAGIWLGWI